MIVGEEEVLNERELLVRVESGLMMDSTDSVCYIILHCSATRCNSDYTVEQLCATIVPVASVLSVITFTSVAMAPSVSIADYSKWVPTAVLSTGAPSVYAMKADWTRKDIPLTRLPRSSSKTWNNF